MCAGLVAGLARPVHAHAERYELDALDRWQKVAEVDPGSEEAQVLAARRALLSGEPSRALNLASALAEGPIGDGESGAGADAGASGDSARAERLYRETGATALAALGATHPLTLANDANFGAFLTDRGRHAEAEVVLARAVSLLEERFGGCHPRTVAARTGLVVARLGLGRAAEARAEAARFEPCAPEPPAPVIWRRALESAIDACRAAGDDDGARGFEAMRARMVDADVAADAERAIDGVVDAAAARAPSR